MRTTLCRLTLDVTFHILDDAGIDLSRTSYFDAVLRQIVNGYGMSEAVEHPTHRDHYVSFSYDGLDLREVEAIVTALGVAGCRYSVDVNDSACELAD